MPSLTQMRRVVHSLEVEEGAYGTYVQKTFLCRWGDEIHRSASIVNNLCRLRLVSYFFLFKGIRLCGIKIACSLILNMPLRVLDRPGL